VFPPLSFSLPSFSFFPALLLCSRLHYLNAWNRPPFDHLGPGAVNYIIIKYEVATENLQYFMVKNITAISASGGNPHKDMSVSFSWHVHSSSYLGSICQAFVTFFLETSNCLAIAGGERKEVYLV